MICKDSLFARSVTVNPRFAPSLIHNLSPQQPIQKENDERFAANHPILDMTAFPLRHRPRLTDSPCSSLLAYQQPEFYHDALAAKQRALYLLKSALTSIASIDMDVTLAVVLLFIEFELIDSGRDNWRYHINGVRIIIEALCGPKVSLQTTKSPLRNFLIANWLVFVGPLKSKHILNTHLC